MIKNYTPHPVNLGGKEYVSVGLARVSQTDTVIGEHDGVEMRKAEYGEVTGLPEKEEGTLFIVSALVKAACPERNDLVSPGGLIRDNAGRVIGASYLIR